MIESARKPPITNDAPAKKLSKGSLTRVTKATRRKRGTGRGKPRAGRLAASRQTAFPFVRLPPELRDYVYKLALPHQELPNSGWATMTGTPNEFMNLLLANKQISAEVRKVLYGLNPFTMVISTYRSSLLGSFDEVSWNIKPIQAPPSLSYIKNWQLALWPEPRLFGSNGYGYGDFFEKDAIPSICSEIAKIDNLQTLKLSVPCLCHLLAPQPFEDFELEDIDDVHDSLVDLLLPLNQLRFAGHVQIMTTSKPRSFPEKRDKKGYIELANLRYEQCSEPICQTFAASFEPLRALLMGKSTTNSLTPHQVKWLDLKSDVEQSGIGLWTDMLQALHDTWDAMVSGSDEFFRNMFWRVKEKLRLHRNAN